MKRTSILIVALAAALALALAGCGGSASPAQVATAAHAESCDNSGFYIVSKITGSKETVYDCSFAVFPYSRCVTYQGGIAADSTSVVRFLFASVLGQTKPSCLLQ